MVYRRILIKDITEQDILSMWFDWFCPEEELLPRGKFLLEKLNEIKDSYLIDKDHNYAYFVNEADGYDELWICDKGHFLFIITPEDNEGKSSVFASSTICNRYEISSKTGNWQDIVHFFGV